MVSSSSLVDSWWFLCFQGGSWNHRFALSERWLGTHHWLWIHDEASYSRDKSFEMQNVFIILWDHCPLTFLHKRLLLDAIWNKILTSFSFSAHLVTPVCLNTVFWSYAWWRKNYFWYHSHQNSPVVTFCFAMALCAQSISLVFLRHYLLFQNSVNTLELNPLFLNLTWIGNSCQSYCLHTTAFLWVQYHTRCPCSRHDPCMLPSDVVAWSLISGIEQ